MARTLYEALGIEPWATRAEIEAACIQLGERYNPEQHPGDVLVYERFSEIERAYATLLDPAKRAQYDEELRKTQPAIVEPFARRDSPPRSSGGGIQQFTQTVRDRPLAVAAVTVLCLAFSFASYIYAFAPHVRATCSTRSCVFENTFRFQSNACVRVVLRRPTTPYPTSEPVCAVLEGYGTKEVRVGLFYEGQGRGVGDFVLPGHVCGTITGSERWTDKNGRVYETTEQNFGPGICQLEVERTWRF